MSHHHTTVKVYGTGNWLAHLNSTTTTMLNDVPIVARSLLANQNFIAIGSATPSYFETSAHAFKLLTLPFEKVWLTAFFNDPKEHLVFKERWWKHRLNATVDGATTRTLLAIMPMKLHNTLGHTCKNRLSEWRWCGADPYLIHFSTSDDWNKYFFFPACAGS